MEEKLISVTAMTPPHRIEANQFHYKRPLRSSLRCVMDGDREIHLLERRGQRTLDGEELGGITVYLQCMMTKPMKS